MDDHDHRQRRPGHSGWLQFGLALAAIAALTAAAITWVVSPNWHRRDSAAQTPNVGVVPTSAPPAALAAQLLLSPQRIEIPRLKAVAPIVEVSTLPDRELDVPRDPKVVGWWNGGAKPGAGTGTAILDGHINYAGVDGVLSRIGTLNPGDTVTVYGVSGGKQAAVRFSVTGVRTYSKQALPWQEIFDQKSTGRLAIVTCGGPFDASSGNYRDNIVAFAVPVGT